MPKKYIQLILTEDEYKKIEHAGKILSMPKSVFVRTFAIQKADEILSKNQGVEHNA